MMLVSLEEAKKWLRIDSDADDDRTTMMIKGASQRIFGYLGDVGTADFTDSTGQPLYDSNEIALNVPDDVKAAVLILTGYLDRGPDGDPDNAYTPGKLPPAVTAQIFHRRDPPLA